MHYPNWLVDEAKLLARGEKLDHISTKAETMQQHTSNFKKRTFEVRRYAWMKHFKACIVLIATVICVRMMVYLLRDIGETHAVACNRLSSR